MKHFFIAVCLLQYIVITNLQAHTIKKLGLEEGLSNSYVVDIVEDKNGYIWIATEEGLNKLEGGKFTSFYKANKGKLINLTGNELNSLFDDPNEPILWIGTQRAGLISFNYQNNTQIIYQHNYQDPHSIITNDITSIHPATDGNLWITTYWRGIEYLDKKTGKFTHYNQQTIPELPSNTVWTAIDDNKGNLYIGHSNHGMSILSTKNKKVKNFTYDKSNNNSLPSNNIQCIFKDNTGNIWVGTEKGLALYKPETETFIRLGEKEPALSHRIYDIQQFNENELWIATEFGGIAIINLSKSLFNTAEEIQFIQAGDNEYNLNNSTVRCLFQDSHQNIWAGTWGGGVNFLSSNTALFKSFSYSSYSSGSSLNAPIASAVCLDKQNYLWVGTDGGGINVLKDGQRIATYTEQTNNLSGNSIQTALCDKQGNLWFGIFYGGIIFYDTHKKTFQQVFPKEYANQDVRSLYEDTEGNIWVGTSDGVFQINRDSKIILQHKHVPDNLVRTVIKDKKGQIWIGSFGGGIFLYSSKWELLKEFNTYQNFPSNTINQIFEDSKGYIWAATGEGLVQFDNKSPWEYKVYQRNEGLANTFIWAIEEDENQNIWFSTNQGISCFVRNERNIYNYDFRDNIPMASFTGRSVCKDKNGTMYFGSTNGLCYFTPSNILEKRQSPKATIGKITIFEPLVSENSNETEISLINKESVQLKYLQNSFNISFSIQDYSLNERIEYAYMLKGLENSWYTVKDPNNVTFRNLPPGKYEFMIKTRIRNQECIIRKSKCSRVSKRKVHFTKRSV